MDFSDVTVVIVCYNEERNIGVCLGALLRQGGGGLYKILVVDGCSTDKTPEIIKQYAAENPAISLLVNPDRCVSSGRNIGWKNAKTSLVAYTDADCVVPDDWLKKLLNAYNDNKQKESSMVAIGGANVPPDDSRFYRALKVFLSSRFGNRGSLQTVIPAKSIWVDHIPTLNIMYERSCLESAGGFDEGFGNKGEDEDLNFRLRKQGKKILYYYGNLVVHRQRSNVRSWASNMYYYGFARTLLMRKHRELRRLRDCMPLMAVFFVFSAFLAPLNYFFILPLACYLSFFILLSLYLAARHGKIALAGDVFLIFIATHFFYGLGMASAAIKNFVYNKKCRLPI